MARLVRATHDRDPRRTDRSSAVEINSAPTAIMGRPDKPGDDVLFSGL